jgi:6-pyruvoyltetrahydropterin/6-carboxytetrahydropterin synthase
VRITRSFEFDAAHRVQRHESKCRRLHGHRWRIEVVLDAARLDEVGRVVDFGVVKAKLGAWIDEHLDHGVLAGRDDAALIEAARLCDTEPYLLKGEPTAENIAAELLLVAGSMLDADGVAVVGVRVWETPNCSAEIG